MKIFLSDLHLGCGDALEDFVFWNGEAPQKTKSAIATRMARMHEAFSDFLQHLLSQAEKRAIAPELIFLGDTFDLLQVLPEDRANPEKIALIESAHRPFFEALSAFHEKGGAVSFVLGNHDHDLLQPPLFAALKKYLPFINAPTSGAPMLFYHDPASGIYAEHGNQWDTLNAYENPADPAEWPFGSELVLRLVNPFEKTYPVIDNLGVREALWFALTRLTEIISLSQKKDMLLESPLKGLPRDKRLKHLAYFLLHQILPGHGDSVLTLLWKILASNEQILRQDANAKRRLEGILFTFRTIGRNPLRIFQEFLTDRLLDAARKIASGCVKETIGHPSPPPRFILFGHSHRAGLRRLGENKTYINTGSWRMRAVPHGRFSLRFDQTLDYALITRTKKGAWTASRHEWSRQGRENVKHEVEK